MAVKSLLPAMAALCVLVALLQVAIAHCMLCQELLPFKEVLRRHSPKNGAQEELLPYKEVLRRHSPKNGAQEELLPFKEVLRRHSPKNGAQEGLLANAC